MYLEVPKVPDFPAIERRILETWKRTQAFAKLRAKNAGRKPWSFLDGPITANNPMGIHHAWGRSLKDMFQRYYAMTGRELRYQNGFDCQGLWVEVEVEKELGFTKKTDVSDYGIDRFVRDCKERVLRFAARITAQSIRLGCWMEWDDPETLDALREALRAGNRELKVSMPSGHEARGSAEQIVARLGCAEYGGSYFTLSNENNFMIWAFLKKCHEQGFIYHGHDVVPWCCRCGTGLSQMEVAEGRKRAIHTSVFVRFPLREHPGEALLVWTTTPWTLTANVAAAVHPGSTYLKIRRGDWVYYLGKGNFELDRSGSAEACEERVRLQSLPGILGPELEILGELPGSDLVGLEYDGPFDHLPAAQRPGGCLPDGAEQGEGNSAVDCHRVIPWEEVSENEGTGIVHIAPGCGAEDHQLGREHGLVAIAPLDESGEYLEGFGELSGRGVLTVADDVVADLKHRGLLVARERYPHVYPHCWRCKQELVFRLVDEWFIRMDWRDRIQRIVGDVRWVPPEGEACEQDWLRNMGDWMISKKRFWGLALPIWVCDDCREFTVVGSREELQERAVEGWNTFAGHSPHRPWIDAVKVPCPSCGALARRIPDVGNPWLDAGIVPFSTMHFQRHPEVWEKWFPADLVIECFPGQFRNWFYALLAMGAMVDGRSPFKAVLGHGLVRDARAQEMHKSLGNAIDFDRCAETLGAEVVRYIFARQNPAYHVNFPDVDGGATSDAELANTVRRRLLTLWNSYSFFITYAALDAWRPSDRPLDVAGLGELDRWILSRLQGLIEAAHKAFRELAPYRLVLSFEQFMDDLSNWYIRRSRRRFWKSGSDRDKEAALSTLHAVLGTVIRVMAPILPFLTEEIYQNLVRSVDPEAPESVHLTDYPEVDESLVDRELERKIECVVQTRNLGLGLRSRSGIKIRQPLARLLVRTNDAVARAALSDEHCAKQVREECNVKALELIDDEKTIVTTRVNANRRTLGRRYGKLLPAIEACLKRLGGAALRDSLDREEQITMEVNGTVVVVTAEDVELVDEAPEHLITMSAPGFFAALDVTITAELEAEGIARDLNRHAQDERRRVGLEIADRVIVAYVASDRIATALAHHDDHLKRELLADRIDRVPTVELGRVVKVGGEKVELAVRRVDA